MTSLSSLALLGLAVASLLFLVLVALTFRGERRRGNQERPTSLLHR